MPTSPPTSPVPPYYVGSWETPSPRAPAGGIWAASTAGAVTALALFALSVYGLKTYGVLLFLVTPFSMGVVAAIVLNYRERYRFTSTLLTLLLAHLLVGLVLLVLAIEGLICLAMAVPLSFPVTIVGATAGIAFAGRGRPRTALMLCLPLLLGSTAIEPQWPLRQVVTEVEIEAPAETVWAHVIDFADLPRPSALVFHLGIAYPLRARLEGEGVGAVRYCEFSTGPFVEPITVWDPPRRLAFDVASQPEPMHEWSPYHKVHAPHLLDGLVSRRGRFDLIPGPGGTTLLRGTTWYELQMGPQAYWGLWSDGIIHQIHLRVLRQIRLESERAVPVGRGGSPVRL